MKKLIVALFASATALFASAKVRTTDFEDNSLGLFSGSEGGVITSNTTSSAAYFPYPCGGVGNNYCEIDADNASFASSNTLGKAFCYFDMNVQFTPRADGDSASIDNAKIAVFLNEDGKIAVLAGASAQDYTKTTYVTDTTLLNGDWARLTICKADGGFKVYINNKPLKVGDQAMVFPSLDGDVNATQVAFDGKGALDNFVARTTDPFFNTDSNYAVNIGGLEGEYYMDYSEGLADALESGSSLSTKDARTMDGSENFPYEIPDLASLKVFQKAITATNGNDKSYALTADIALDAPWPGIGIQNGKDLVSYDVSKIGQAEADRRDAAFETGAFKGTFDGRDHTISGFRIVGKGSNAEGLDYAGFFNSTRGATIQNLKIQYAGSLFAADTTASTKESGATFVGVAKNSTLRNLTTIAGTVSCSKGFGGIVGYLMGTTVDSCTNNVNMTSLANNKCGGIAMICQKAGCSISNCENNGTMTTTSGEHGGIVGYTDSITISDCNNTAACKMFYHHGGTVTLSGENTGSATVASYTGVATPGLNFATVDGNVATFVSDDGLAAGETYKVMASGATAAYEFTEAGTIAFDTALAPTFVGNVTADTTTLVLAEPVTEGTVTTYAATAGVASVDNFAYATFADAVDALDGATDDYVTLLANAYINLNQGDRLRVKTGQYVLTVIKSQNVAIIENKDDDNIMTFEAVAAVATVGGTGFATLLDAIANAADGKTVKLLADVTLDARVEPDIGSGTMLTIDLGGKTITRTGTSGNGSVFDVKSGNVTITNGVINCTQNDTAIVAGGVYAITARSGANVTLDTLTVTVDSECGACVYPFAGATVTILGGTYANRTSTPYRYKTAWTGMAVNQANVASQLIAISGGSFKQVNPALGDDSWASAGNGFLASGYVATWNPSTDYYDVAEYVPPSGVDPTDPTSEQIVKPTAADVETYGSAEDAAKAIATVNVPEAVSDVVDATTYKTYFNLVATPGEDGTYSVTASGLNPEVVLPVDGEKETPLTEMLESVAEAAADATGETAASVPTKPGLYYWIEGATDVGAASYTPGTAELGDGTEKELSRPTLTGENGKAFFKVCVGVAAPAKD